MQLILQIYALIYFDFYIMLDRNDYRAIYGLLATVNPVPYDCGTICGEACCQSGDEDIGIFLLPGEEKIRNLSEWESYEKTDDCYFVKCKGPKSCDRQNRPIQCRTFPLFPVLQPDGKFSVEANPIELPYGCPLIEAGAKLDSDFIEATAKAWEKLLDDPDVFELIKKWNESINSTACE